MRKLIKDTVSPKLMVAILAAASFVAAPAITQAGEKGPEKKAEQMMKKEAKKMEQHAPKAGKEAKKEEHKAKKEMKKEMKKMEKATDD